MHSFRIHTQERKMSENSLDKYWYSYLVYLKDAHKIPWPLNFYFYLEYFALKWNSVNFIALRICTSQGWGKNTWNGAFSLESLKFYENSSW